MKIIQPAIWLLIHLTVFISCNAQTQKPAENKAGKSALLNIGETVSALGKNIDCIFQDRNNNYWFASNAEGVYRYDGEKIIHITDKNGLCSNYVWAIQEDINGKLWFTTRDGVCCFNGETFTNYTDVINNAITGNLHYQSGGLFFGLQDGVGYFDGKSFMKFTIHPGTYKPEANSLYRPYSIYSSWADNTGNVWFGTQEKGVARYDGNTFSWLSEKDLAGPAVRTIFQDKKGNLWFGNNGGGLFRYDGKTLTNITEEKGLGNPEFLKGKKLIDKPGTLARVWAINEDNNNQLWIGTIDAGLWKYDGNTLTNYSTKDGLSGNAVWGIYKDKKGELWFIINGEDIYKLSGESFTKFQFK